MKKTIIAISILLASGTLSAQVKLGARTGVNIANQSISGSTSAPEAITGYYAGVFVDFGIIR